MKYKYRPRTKKELINVIKKEIFMVQGTSKNPNWKADLNCIDTSLITDMSYLFAENGLFFEGYNLEHFNGDISKWNVSNVKNMSNMFVHSKFNQDISNWNVSNVENMENMFWSSIFNRDISKWDVSNVKNMSSMFRYSQFNQDISNWDVSNVRNMSGMFLNSKFNQDISNWDVSNVKDMSWMFKDSKFDQDISKWNVSNVENMNEMFENSKFNGDIGSWPLKLKKQTDLKNISVSLEYKKLPDKIVSSETVANIFIHFTNSNFDNHSILNCLFKITNKNLYKKNNFKKIFEEFLKNRKEIYKSKNYKPNIINKLVLNDIVNILKHLKDKDMQNKFMKITINKCDKKPVINID